MNFLYLNETKNDFLNFFISIMTPQLSNSVLEVYNHVMDVYNNLEKVLVSNKQNNKLKQKFNLEKINFQNLSENEKKNIFQKLRSDIFKMYIEKIYRWNNQQITEEYNRIKITTKTIDYFDNLVKSCFKSYLLFISYDPTTENSFLDKKYLNDEFYNNINIVSFIHTCFLQTFSFCENNYDYFVKKIKKNEMNEIIKITVMNSIKISIPNYNDILKNYLQINQEINQEKNQENETQKIKSLIQEVLHNDFNKQKFNNNTVINDNSDDILNKNIFNKYNNNNVQILDNNTNNTDDDEKNHNNSENNELNNNNDVHEIFNDVKQDVNINENIKQEQDDYLNKLKTVSNLESNYIKSVRITEDKNMEEFFEKNVE